MSRRPLCSGLLRYRTAIYLFPITTFCPSGAWNPSRIAYRYNLSLNAFPMLCMYQRRHSHMSINSQKKNIKKNLHTDRHPRRSCRCQGKEDKPLRHTQRFTTYSAPAATPTIRLNRRVVRNICKQVSARSNINNAVELHFGLGIPLASISIA